MENLDLTPEQKQWKDRAAQAQVRIDELTANLADLRRGDWAAQAIKKVGLSPDLAAALKGDTQEAIEENAKELRATLAKINGQEKARQTREENKNKGKQPPAQPSQDEQGQKPQRRYGFERPGERPWPTGPISRTPNWGKAAWPD